MFSLYITIHRRKGSCRLKSEPITGLNDGGHYSILPHTILQKQLTLTSPYSSLCPALETDNKRWFQFLSSLYHWRDDIMKQRTTKKLLKVHCFHYVLECCRNSKECVPGLSCTAVYYTAPESPVRIRVRMNCVSWNCAVHNLSSRTWQLLSGLPLTSPHLICVIVLEGRYYFPFSQLKKSRLREVK